MEGHLFTIELIALATGITVIAIETVIIFLLRNHTKALDTHLNHLNEHSHKIESMLTTICSHEEEILLLNQHRKQKSLSSASNIDESQSYHLEPTAHLKTDL